MSSRFASYAGNYDLFMKTLFSYYRNVADFDKLKILMKDPTWPEDKFKAIFKITHEKIERGKLADVPVKKPKKGKEKIVFEPDYYEKFPATVTANEKMKIIAFNESYERVIRYNIIECVNKVVKIEPDKESLNNEIKELYEDFYAKFYPTAAEILNLDLFEFKCDEPQDDPNDINANMGNNNNMN